MVQVIRVDGAESPLFQAIQGLAGGLQNYQQTSEQIRQKKRQELEDERRHGSEDFSQSLGIAQLLQQIAANTPEAQAPRATPEELGVTPLPPDQAGPEIPEVTNPPASRKAPEVTLPGGRKVPLAPVKYKEEAEAEATRKLRQEQDIKENVDVPNDPETFGAAAGKRTPASIINAYIAAGGRKEAANIAAGTRKDAAQAKADEKTAKMQEIDSEADAWVDSLDKDPGTVLGDVPAKLRDKVKLRAKERAVALPSRKLSDATMEKWTDSKNLLARLEHLDELESGFRQWSLSKVPDALTELTGLGEKAKIYQPAYFLYTAEVVKSLQGRPSDYDMKSFLSVMPQIGDPPEVKKKKVAQLKAQLVSAYNTKVTTYNKAGYNTRGFDLVAEPEVSKPTPEQSGSPTLTPKAPTSSLPQAPQITTAEEFNALPRGTVFIDPKGVRRRKP